MANITVTERMPDGSVKLSNGTVVPGESLKALVEAGYITIHDDPQGPRAMLKEGFLMLDGSMLQPSPSPLIFRGMAMTTASVLSYCKLTGVGGGTDSPGLPYRGADQAATALASAMEYGPVAPLLEATLDTNPAQLRATAALIAAGVAVAGVAEDALSVTRRSLAGPVGKVGALLGEAFRVLGSRATNDVLLSETLRQANIYYKEHFAKSAVARREMARLRDEADKNAEGKVAANARTEGRQQARSELVDLFNGINKK